MSVIGVDLDHTLVAGGSWTGPGEITGTPCATLLPVLRQLHETGHVLCVWSCRAEHLIWDWLRTHGIADLFEHVNDSPYPSDSGKRHFDVLIDDKGFHWHPEASVPELLLRAGPVLDRDPRERDMDWSDRNLRPFYRGAGKMFIDHFEGLWQDLWKQRAVTKPVAFLTICSHAKPYSKSFIHTSIRKRLYQEGLLDDVDYIHISGAGIIPQSAEMVYPFNAYDGDSSTYSPDVKAHHVAAIKRRFLEWHRDYADAYDEVIIYLRAGGNTEGAISDAMDEIDATAPGGVPLKLVRAQYAPDLPFSSYPDIDDCLTLSDNLQALVSAMTEEN